MGRIKEEYEARETSPPPQNPSVKVSQHLEDLKSNREHMEDWWGKRTAGDGRPCLEQTFDGKQIYALCLSVYLFVLKCLSVSPLINLWLYF